MKNENEPKADLQGGAIVAAKVRCELAVDPAQPGPLTRDNTRDVIREHHEGEARAILQQWRSRNGDMRDGFRAWTEAGGPCPVNLMNAALLTVWEYPRALGEIGMHFRGLRTRATLEDAAARIGGTTVEADIARSIEANMTRALPVAEAASVVESALRTAGVILSRAAADIEGVTPAAIENGLMALRRTYEAAPDRDGTESGVAFPSVNSPLWPDCMTARDWDRQGEPGKTDLLRLRDALVALNHSTGKTPDKAAPETTNGTAGKSPAADVKPDGGAEVRRAGFLLDPANTPGALGDILREIEIENPDALQILNLRKERTKNGKPLSWDKIADRFERQGKPGRKMSGERLRQIYKGTMAEYPRLAGIVSGQMARADVVEDDGPEDDEDDLTTIRRETERNTAFDKNEIGAEDDGGRAGYSITNDPRKPGYLANRKAR